MLPTTETAARSTTTSRRVQHGVQVPPRATIHGHHQHGRTSQYHHQLFRHTHQQITGTNGYNSRSATSTTKQFYSAPIVPDAPQSGDRTDDYDDAIGAEQHAAKSSHAAHADGGDASHRIEQGLRRFGEWLMLLNAIKRWLSTVLMSLGGAYPHTVDEA